MENKEIKLSFREELALFVFGIICLFHIIKLIFVNIYNDNANFIYDRKAKNMKKEKIKICINIDKDIKDSCDIYIDNLSRFINYSLKRYLNKIDKKNDNNYNEIAYDNEDDEIDYDMQARMNDYFNKKKGE